MPGQSPNPSTGIRHKLLSFFLLAALLGAVGALAYILTLHPAGDKFTEFYILGLDGGPASYPTVLMAGEKGGVIAAIVNHEYSSATYRIEVRVDGVKNSEAGPVTLANGEKWQEKVYFTPRQSGQEVRVEFLLYREGQTDAYRSLRLWIEVTGPGALVPAPLRPASG